MRETLVQFGWECKYANPRYAQYPCDHYINEPFVLSLHPDIEPDFTRDPMTLVFDPFKRAAPIGLVFFDETWPISVFNLMTQQMIYPISWGMHTETNGLISAKDTLFILKFYQTHYSLLSALGLYNKL